MAWTSADLDRINTAIASGIQIVQYADGRRVQYQNLDQMLAAKRVIQAELDMQSTAKSSLTRRRVPYYRSGL